MFAVCKTCGSDRNLVFLIITCMYPHNSNPDRNLTVSNISIRAGRCPISAEVYNESGSPHGRFSFADRV